jgi:hypothetical protein
MRRATVLAALIALACTDFLQPGRTYDLVSVDGQPLPWSSPSGSGGFIASGSVKIDDDTLAERSENTNTGGWTRTGKYQVKAEMLIIDYGQIYLAGPSQRVDTFVVSGGKLELRADSLTRRYALP